MCLRDSLLTQQAKATATAAETVWYQQAVEAASADAGSTSQIHLRLYHHCTASNCTVAGALGIAVPQSWCHACMPGSTRLDYFLQLILQMSSTRTVHWPPKLWAGTMYPSVLLTEAIQAEAAAAVVIGSTCHVNSDGAQLAACIQYHSV